jgi:hypothetical protein
MPTEDRRYESWPTVNLNNQQEFLPQSPTELAKMEALRRAMSDPPPVTPLGQSLGINDIIDMQRFNNLAASDLYGSYTAPIGQKGAEIPPAPMAPPANFQAPQPQGYGGPMPNINVNPWTQRPNIGLSLPTAAGNLQMEGGYKNPYDWKATLGLRREF